MFDLVPLSPLPSLLNVVLYAGLAIGLILFCRSQISRLALRPNDPLPPTPAEPPPYETAYLRGGARDTARVMVLLLLERGYLQVRETPDRRGRRELLQAGAPPDLDALSELERRVFDYFDQPWPAEEALFEEIARQETAVLAGFHERWAEKGLLYPESSRRWLFALWLVGAWALCVMALVLLRGSGPRSGSEAFVAWGLFLVSHVGLASTCWLRTLRTARGDAYLRRLQGSLEPLRRKSQQVSREAAQGWLPVLAAVYGVHVLPNVLAQEYARTDMGGCIGGYDAYVTDGGGGNDGF